MVRVWFQEGARSSSGRVAILSWARRRMCASFWVSLAQPAPLCHWQPFPCSSEESLFWVGARSHKRKREAALWSGAQLSCVRPKLQPQQLLQQPQLQPELPSAPLLLPQSQAQQKGSLTCFRAHSGHTRSCLVPVFPVFLCWGNDVKL